MKKIITVLTAVLLLCGMVFSMASCGEVDMAEVKTAMQGLADADEKIVVEFVEGVEATETAAKHNIFTITVYGEDSEGSWDYKERLVVTEYANSKLAKLQYKMEKWEKDEYAEYYELEEKYEEERGEVGDKVDEAVEQIIKRKGNVVIIGSKNLYEKIF